MTLWTKLISTSRRADGRRRSRHHHIRRGPRDATRPPRVATATAATAATSPPPPSPPPPPPLPSPPPGVVAVDRLPNMESPVMKLDPVLRPGHGGGVVPTLGITAAKVSRGAPHPGDHRPGPGAGSGPGWEYMIAQVSRSGNWLPFGTFRNTVPDRAVQMYRRWRTNLAYRITHQTGWTPSRSHTPHVTLHTPAACAAAQAQLQVQVQQQQQISTRACAPSRSVAGAQVASYSPVGVVRAVRHADQTSVRAASIPRRRLLRARAHRRASQSGGIPHVWKREVSMSPCPGER